MQYLYVGTPGSGKSIEAIKCLVSNLKKRSDDSIRHVYTNIDGLNDSECREHIKILAGLDDWEIDTHLHYIDESDIETFWVGAKPSSIFFIDEAQDHFNAKDAREKKNIDLAKFCSKHRHDGHDIIFMTQSIDNIDKQVRSKTQFTYGFRKIDFFGKIAGLFKADYRVFYFVGDSEKGEIDTATRKYDPRLFKCYKSYSNKAVKEMGILKPVNILRKPIFLAMPVVLIWLIYSFARSGFAHGEIVPGMNNVKHGQPITASTNTVNKSGVVMTASKIQKSTPHGSAAVKKPADKEKGWLYTGYVRYKGQSVVMLKKGETCLYYPEYRLNSIFRCEFKKMYSVGDRIDMKDDEKKFSI